MAKKRATIVPEVRKTVKKTTRKKAPPSSPKKRAPKKPEPPKRTPRKKAATKQKPEETVDLKEELAAKLPDIDFDISTPIPRVDPTPFLSGGGNGNSIASILNIKWSKYIPFEPLPKQLAALMLADEDELLFGGALGGSKSTWLAMESLRFMDLPGYAAIIFRRQLTDLKQPGGLIPKILQWLSPFQAQGLCQYHASEHIVRFKTFWPGTDIPGPDSMLQFGYIGEAAVRERYQSAEYQTCCFDELGNWPEADDYLFMMSRLRKTVCPIHGKDAEGVAIYDQSCYQCRAISQVVPRMRAACNPGPAWIKRRFGIRPDPTQYKTTREALIAIQEGHKVRWVGSPGHPKFIPSYLWDNKHLDSKAYKRLLAEMPESERSRLEDGNWESRVDARFKRKWQRFAHLHIDPELLKEYPEQYINELTKEKRNYSALEGAYSYIEFDNLGNSYQSEPIPLRSLKRIFLTADPAVTVQRGPVDEQIKQKNSFTGIGVFGETRNDELLWLAGQKFRKELPDVIDAITFLNYIWKPSMNKIEASGVGIGAAQFLESAGFPVTKNWKKTDKVENSMSAQLLMRHGKILFPINALWLERMEDVIFSWTGLPSEEDDMVDVISDAGNEISLKIAREIVTHRVTKSLPCSVSSFHSGRVVVPQYGISRNHF
jgi:hypothetical protein